MTGREAKPEIDWTPKSGKSRTIKILEDLRAILESQGPGEGWLFKGRNGTRRKGFRKPFYKARKDAGLAEDITAHCLRHTFATMMIQSGVDAKNLSQILGHSSPVVTLTVYAHAFSEVQDQAINKLPSFEREAGEIIPFQAGK